MADKPKSNKPKSKLTDPETFWKLLVIVIAAVIAEAILLGLATSDFSLDWSAGQVTHIERPAPTDLAR